VNFWQIFQLFKTPERDRGGDSAARRLFDALKSCSGRHRHRHRRASQASASLRLESLEVRQVLSSVGLIPQDADPRGLSGQALEPTPAALSALWMSEAETSGAENLGKGIPGSEMSDVARIVRSFRGQLSAAITSVESALPGKIAQSPGDQAQRSDFVSGDVYGLALVAGLPEDVTPRSSVNVRVVLDWSESDQPVTVVTWAGDDLEVSFRGLGSTSLVGSDAAFTEDLIVVNAKEIFGKLLPGRSVAVSFQKPTAIKDAFVRFDQVPPDSSSRVTTTVGESAVEKPVSVPSEVPANGSRSSRVPLPGESIVVEEATEPVGLIDEVFLEGSLIADDASLPSFSNPGLSPVKQNANATEQNGDVPNISLPRTLRNAAFEIDATVITQARSATGVVLPGVVPSFVRRGWALLKSGKWLGSDTAVRRSLADVQQGQLSDGDLRANASAEMPEDLNQVLDWLTWIMNPAAERQASDTGQQNESHTETRPSPVPVRQASVARDVQASSWSLQSPARRQRDSLRQYAAWGGCCSVFCDELEMVPLPVSGSFPAELRYECQPRGPPVYGRDVVTPSAKVDAPESVLERLRYSIAPRGPSLVTVEMQSPDFEFSSGPRVSPEELRSLAV